MLVSLLATSVTVLVPWLIGANALRDSAFRPASGLVYSISDRDGGAYFLTDYLAGLVVTTAIAGALLMLAALIRIRHRIGRLVTGAGLVVLALAALIPQSASAWTSAELATAQAEAAGPPGRYGAGCGRYSAGDATVQLLSESIWHTWTAIPIDDDGDGACTEVEIWDGIKLVRTINTPNVRDGILVGIAGSSVHDSYFVFLASGAVPDCGRSWCQADQEFAGGFALNADAVEWTRNVRLTWQNPSSLAPGIESPQVVSSPGVGPIVVENPAAPNSAAVTLAAADGSIVARTICPAGAGDVSRLFDNDEGRHIIECWNQDADDSDLYVINADGTLTPWSFG